MCDPCTVSLPRLLSCSGVVCHRVIQTSETTSVLHFCCIGGSVNRGECSLQSLSGFTARIPHHLFGFWQGNNGAYSYLPYSALDNCFRKSSDWIDQPRVNRNFSFYNIARAAGRAPTHGTKLVKFLENYTKIQVATHQR